MAAIRFPLLAALCALPLLVAGDPETPAARKYLNRPGFTWTCENESVFRFCYDPAIKSDIPTVKQSAAESLQVSLKLAGVTRYTAHPRIYIFVLDSNWRLQDLVHVYASGASEPKDHAVFVVTGRPDTLTHELNHEILATLWGRGEPWLAEGFAAYAAAPEEIDRQALRLLDTPDYIPLANMVGPEWNAHTYPSTRIYPELGSFVKFLHDTRGLAPLKEVWRRGSQAIPQSLGKPLPDLEREWHESLRKRFSLDG